MIVGAITAVGGGTLRDVLSGRTPSVLTSGLYAIPALLGAATTLVLISLEISTPLAAAVGALLCFAVRLVAVRFDLDGPFPPAQLDDGPRDGE